jgi:hypothetical protein
MPALRVFLLVLLFTSLDAAAQLPPAPDATRYPQLASMKRWLESGAEPARQCALSAGLFTDATQMYRQTRSEAKTVDAMMKGHAQKLDAAARERLRTTLTYVTGMAAGLAGLGVDSAPIAYSQLCIGRAQKPNAAVSPEALQVKFEAALRCERAHAVGSLERKECVAAAFKL